MSNNNWSNNFVSKFMSSLLEEKNASRTKEILSVNPTLEQVREHVAENISVIQFNAQQFDEIRLGKIEDLQQINLSNKTTWIDIDGINKKTVEYVCNYFDVHQLVAEDILSFNQRPKMDEAEKYIYAVLNIIYLNDKNFEIESEQISILLFSNMVITFQGNPSFNVFNPLREKLKLLNSKIRQRTADFLCYSLLDLIIDNYYVAMEKLSQQVETIEDELDEFKSSEAILSITHLRREYIVLKRNITPVRELLNDFIRSDSDLLEERHTKYYKDVYDHIIQAIDLLENYRDVIANLLDLHYNNLNLKLNEVMKVMAIVTCLMAPAAIIGGMFGMNFSVMPFIHSPYGFYGSLAAMLLIPLAMVIIFKRRGWY